MNVRLTSPLALGACMLTLIFSAAVSIGVLLDIKSENERSLREAREQYDRLAAESLAWHSLGTDLVTRLDDQQRAIGPVVAGVQPPAIPYELSGYYGTKVDPWNADGGLYYDEEPGGTADLKFCVTRGQNGRVLNVMFAGNAWTGFRSCK